jgi:hypothetical protein
MKLGIVGSSYSVGSHVNHDTGTHDLVLPFENWFKGIDVVNAACAGKGTELYLGKVMYLKKEHGIDTLLMESINNRSMLNVNTQLDAYKVIQKNDNIHDIINEVFKDSASIYPYKRYIHQEIDFQQFGSESEFNVWKEFQKNIASDSTMNEFWGLIDMAQTIDLCKLLDIKVVTWANRWHMEQLPSFKSVIQDQTYVKFGNELNAYDYYSKKYDPVSIRCDTAHFTDAINEEMVNDFIMPALLNA